MNRKRTKKKKRVRHTLVRRPPLPTHIRLHLDAIVTTSSVFHSASFACMYDKLAEKSACKMTTQKPVCGEPQPQPFRRGVFKAP